MHTLNTNGRVIVQHRRRRRWGKYRRIFNFVLIYSTVIVDFMGYTLLAPLGYYFILYFNVNAVIKHDTHNGVWRLIVANAPPAPLAKH
mmetsp:Transcript_4356/g.3543  ORF Transcript_4356/g.3543 Transcript_4356/m.3543 type:complete len:88 (+) Transcript_4356:196-459(+)